MDFLGGKLEEYVAAHSTQENDVLKALNRETNAKVMMPQMLSGHIQGRILSMISHMIMPKVILEIGTFTGYSGICLAEGLAENGKLISIDINEELEDMVRNYWEKAGISDKAQMIIGNALDILPKLNETLDLVFIDADKINYSNYYDLALNKVRQGGFIIADNVLWSGKVIEPGPDKDTSAIINFNEKIQNDSRVENVLLPVRDGLMLIRKK